MGAAGFRTNSLIVSNIQLFDEKKIVQFKYEDEKNCLRASLPFKWHIQAVATK